MPCSMCDVRRATNRNPWMPLRFTFYVLRFVFLRYKTNHPLTNATQVLSLASPAGHAMIFRA